MHVDYGFQSLAEFPWGELQIPKPEDSVFHEQNPDNLRKGEQKNNRGLAPLLQQTSASPVNSLHCQPKHPSTLVGT